MRFYFATIPVRGGADAEQARDAFLGSHRVLNIERHLIADGAQSVWVICVTCTDATSPAPLGFGASRGGPGPKERIDYREILDEVAFAKFARLRVWRKQAAERAAVLPYAVFTNGHLAESVRRPVQTLAVLAEIEGVGAARVDKCGPAVLEVRQTGAANRNANPRDDHDANLSFPLAGVQTQTHTTCNRSAPDQTAVASGSDCQRTLRGPQRASSGSGCAVERSPGVPLSRSWKKRS